MNTRLPLRLRGRRGLLVYQLALILLAVIVLIVVLLFVARRHGGELAAPSAADTTVASALQRGMGARLAAPLST